MSRTDVFTDAMRQAIGLSERALGRTSPNPIVGCVVLDSDDTVVGTGYHRRAGGPHAEVNALAEAGDRAMGGTAVVTLEPCVHTGRTGPCALALRTAGVTRVVYAVPDPNPTAAGGATQLRAAGIEVVGDVLRAEAERANEMWLTAVRSGRPFVTWKFAGHLAASEGSSRRITSARDDYLLRATHDAILVGAGTVHTDDPRLGLRHGTEVLPLPDSGTGPSPRALLSALYARGVRSVLLECGAKPAADFVTEGLVNRIVAEDVENGLPGPSPGYGRPSWSH